MGISVNSPGNYNQTRGYLKSLLGKDIYGDLDAVGVAGVDALSRATPSKTGKAASSWYYVIKEEDTQIAIEWHNNDVIQGALLVVMLDKGHGTRTGAFVAGRHYIKSAIDPVMIQAIDDVWGKVVNDGSKR